MLEVLEKVRLEDFFIIGKLCDKECWWIECERLLILSRFLCSFFYLPQMKRSRGLHYLVEKGQFAVRWVKPTLTIVIYMKWLVVWFDYFLRKVRGSIFVLEKEKEVDMARSGNAVATVRLDDTSTPVWVTLNFNASRARKRWAKRFIQ